MNKFIILLASLICHSLSAEIYDCNNEGLFITEKVDEEKFLQIFHSHTAPEKFTFIHVYKGEGLTDQTLNTIGKECPALEELVIAGGTITDEGIDSIAKGCPHLKSIAIAKGQVSDEARSKLSHLKGVQLLSSDS